MRKFRFNRIRKPARDFLCALVAFSMLFVAMSPSREIAGTIPFVSLFNGSEATAASYRQMPAGAAGPVSFAGAHGLTNGFAQETLPPINTPLISSVLAFLFASIVTVNLALLRHLRRVNASSWRGAWKEG